MFPSWLLGGVYLGNRKPRDGDNLLSSTVPFTEAELQVRTLAKRTLERLYGEDKGIAS